MVRAARLAVAVSLAAGCSFDSGGLRTPDRGQLAGEGADLRAPVEGPAPDHARPADRPREQALLPDQASQGTTCKDGGYTISSSKPPTAGATLTLQVKGPPRTWIMAGVSTPTVPFGWTGGATNDGLTPTTWTFAGVKVPASPGPYLFGFMADALNDNPAVGKLLAKCLP